MDDKILFVDDEQNLLDGIRRELFDSYDITTALGGEEGLKILKAEGPFSVVVSDMRMPVMDGATFLSIVNEKYPESVKIMLTGNTDQETAIKAVNEGNIFQFLNKPCPTDMLKNILDASLKQYHLIIAEKELLENTLQGGINMLVNILSLTNPVAFSRATRVKYFVKELALSLHLPNIWQYEVSAMLSQVGCVTIPSDILEKLYTNQNLSIEEQDMLKQYPVIGHDLIINIPRLESVARIIANQQKDFQELNKNTDKKLSSQEIIGAAILRLAIDFDTLLFKGLSREDAFNELDKNNQTYHLKLISSLKEIKPPALEKKLITVKIKDLHKGMMLEKDLSTKQGMLLAKKGQEISHTMKLMLENYLKQNNIVDGVLISLSVY